MHLATLRYSTRCLELECPLGTGELDCEPSSRGLFGARVPLDLKYLEILLDGTTHLADPTGNRYVRTVSALNESGIGVYVRIAILTINGQQLQREMPRRLHYLFFAQLTSLQRGIVHYAALTGLSVVQIWDFLTSSSY